MIGNILVDIKEDTVNVKTCTGCGKELSIDLFPTYKKAGRIKHCSKCRQCRRDNKKYGLQPKIRICRVCHRSLDISCFPTRSRRKDGSVTYRGTCKECKTEHINNLYSLNKKKDPFYQRCQKIKASAKSRQLPFNLTPEYLRSIWRTTCPISKQKLDWTVDRTHPNHPELDRLIPELGYIQGNVAWISRRMNAIKNNATEDELRAIYQWIKRKIKRNNK